MHSTCSHAADERCEMAGKKDGFGVARWKEEAGAAVHLARLVGVHRLNGSYRGDRFTADTIGSRSFTFPRMNSVATDGSRSPAAPRIEKAAKRLNKSEVLPKCIIFICSLPASLPGHLQGEKQRILNPLCLILDAKDAQMRGALNRCVCIGTQRTMWIGGRRDVQNASPWYLSSSTRGGLDEL